MSGRIPPDEWDRFVVRHPAAHVLQTAPWGSLKERFGWEAERVWLSSDGEPVAGAQLLYRRLPAVGGVLAYIPKGPLVAWDDEAQVAALFPLLVAAARARRAIAITIEPDLSDEPRWRARLRSLGLRPAPFAGIQPRRTLIVDIGPEEADILAAMKSKTRYNVRLATRRGVTVRPASADDLPAFHALMAVTGARDRFGVHAPEYYEAAYRLFVPRGWARLLLAEVAGEPVAAVMVFALPPRAWYFYGASGDAHREKMPTYLLQWEAMRWARSLGCTSYDLWGVPDEERETLEAQFTRRRDGLWGVYRFKRGFGGRLVRTVGAWDLVLAPARYAVYRWLVRWRSAARRRGATSE